MENFILRKEIGGNFLYDKKNNAIFFSPQKNDFDYCSEHFSLLSSKKTIQLSTDYFNKNTGKSIDNSYFGNIFSAPATVFFEVTKKCNLKCRHCFNNSGKKAQNELTLNEIKNIIDGIYEAGVFNVKITGGEPFARADIFDILNYLEKKEINYIIFSNGTIFNTEILHRLKLLKHLIKIRISIDGNELTNDLIRGIGTYKLAISTLKQLSDNGLPCELNYTITKSNYNQITEVSNVLIDKHINCKINLGFVKISGRAYESNQYYFTENEIIKVVDTIDEQIKNSPNINVLHLLEPIYYKLYKKSFGCPAGRLSLTIKSNGNVYACGLFSDHDELCCGNTKSLSLIEIWNSKAFDRFRNLTCNSECNTCIYFKNNCTGACRGNALNYFNDICGQDINCYLYKTKFGEETL